MKSLPVTLGSLDSYKNSGTTIIRFLLFLTLFISGLAKLISPVHSETLISQLVPAVLFPVVQVALPICELLLSFMFLHPSSSIAASSISVLAFLGSTVVGIVFLDVPTECGCFGTLFESHVDELFLLRNIILLFMSLFLLRSLLLQKGAKSIQP